MGGHLLNQRLLRARRKIIPAPCQHFVQLQDRVPRSVATYVSKKAAVCTFCSKKSVVTDAAPSCEPGVIYLLEGKPWSTVLTGLICCLPEGRFFSPTPGKLPCKTQGWRQAKLLAARRGPRMAAPFLPTSSRAGRAGWENYNSQHPFVRILVNYRSQNLFHELERVDMEIHAEEFCIMLCGTRKRGKPGSIGAVLLLTSNSCSQILLHGGSFIPSGPSLVVPGSILAPREPRQQWKERQTNYRSQHPLAGSTCSSPCVPGGG